MGWSCRKNSRGGTGGEFPMSGGSVVGGQRIPRGGARCAGSRRVSEAGTTEQQRDCCEARDCYGKGTDRASSETRGIGRRESADGQKQRSQNGRRGAKQERIVSGRDGGGGLQEPDGGRTNLDEDSGCHAGICERDTRIGVTADTGRTRRNARAGHHAGIRSRYAE